MFCTREFKQMRRPMRMWTDSREHWACKHTSDSKHSRFVWAERKRFSNKLNENIKIGFAFDGRHIFINEFHVRVSLYLNLSIPTSIFPSHVSVLRFHGFSTFASEHRYLFYANRSHKLWILWSFSFIFSSAKIHFVQCAHERTYYNGFAVILVPYLSRFFRSCVCVRVLWASVYSSYHMNSK